MMKKYLFLLAAVLFLLVGCGKSNQVVCTGTQTESGISMKMTIKANIKDNKVSKAMAEISFDDKTIAEQYCSLLKSFGGDEIKAKCKGSTIVFESARDLIGEDLDEVTKEEFIEMATEEGLKCK